MERKVNYIVVGAFSLALVAGLIGFVLWAHYRGDHKPKSAYTVFFDQAVNGLSVGSAVRYLGVEAGQVQSIALDVSAPIPRVRVTVGMDAGVPIPPGTIALLRPSGITGVSFVDLHTDTHNPMPLTKESDGTLIIPSQAAGFDRLMDEAALSIQRLDLLLSNENIKHINMTFANLDSISTRFDAMLAAHQGSINKFLGPDLDELNDTIHSTRKTMDSISALSKSLKDNPSQLIFPGSSQDIKVAP
jgi:phospholipid/cholesterol/gamma-HCH transport system substrate-binding protein